MAKLLSDNFLLLGKRSFSVAVENAGVQRPTSGAKKTKDLITEASNAEPDRVFWMRDPKTGNWLPENRFDEVDVAELREQLLSQKKGTLKKL